MRVRSSRSSTRHVWMRQRIVLILLSSAILLSTSSAVAAPVVHEHGFVVELWLSGVGDLRGVTAGPGGDFSNYPYVGNRTDGTVMRVTDQGVAEVFVSGLPVGAEPDENSYKITFGPDDFFWSGDMFVSSPYDHSGPADPIFRVNADGQRSVFYQNSSLDLLTNGIAFGEGGFGDYLYIIDTERNNLSQITASGSRAQFGGGVTSGDFEDDLLISGGGAFGEYVYITDAFASKILRMSTAGVTQTFAEGLSGVAIALGEGGFGEYLYIGTGGGDIYRLDSWGQATLFASGFIGTNKNRIRGLDINDNTMWLTVTGGFLYKISSNAPPTADAGADQTITAASNCATAVLLDGSGSIDPDSTEGTNDDIVSFEWLEDGIPIGTGETLDYTFSLGVHTITLVVTDSFGETGTDEVVITIVDTTPPELSVSVSPDTLWPPNHKMVLCTPTVAVSDNCDPSPTVSLVSVTSNESEEAYTYDPAFDMYTSEGHTDDDIRIDNGDIYLRAERSAHGDGRVYTVTYEATDASGNSATESATITVPHNQ